MIFRFSGYLVVILSGYNATRCGNGLAPEAPSFEDAGAHNTAELRVWNTACPAEGETGSQNSSTSPFKLDPPSSGGGTTYHHRLQHGAAEPRVEVYHLPGHEQGHGSTLPMVWGPLATSGRATIYRPSEWRWMELATFEGKTQAIQIAGKTKAATARRKGQGQAEAGPRWGAAYLDTFATALEECRGQRSWLRSGGGPQAARAARGHSDLLLVSADAGCRGRGNGESGGGQRPSAHQNLAHADHQPRPGDAFDLTLGVRCPQGPFGREKGVWP